MIKESVQNEREKMQRSRKIANMKKIQVRASAMFQHGFATQCEPAVVDKKILAEAAKTFIEIGRKSKKKQNFGGQETRRSSEK